MHDIQSNTAEIRRKKIITSKISCLNTRYAYVYELEDGDIVSIKKIHI